MATVTGLTADRMLAIEAASVVDGDVVGDNLLLTKHDGSTINAGSVRGPQGTAGTNGTNGTNANAGDPWSNGVTYPINSVVGYASRLYKSIASSGNLDKCPAFNNNYWTALTQMDSEGWTQNDPTFAQEDFDGWELFWRGGTVAASVTQTAGEFETGFQAMKLVLAASSTQRLYERDENLVRGGEVVTITVRAKLAAAAPGLTLKASLFQAPPNGSPQPFGTGSTEPAAIQGPQTLTTSWQTYTFTVTAVNAKPRCRHNLLIETTAAGGATVFIDWVRVSRTVASQIRVAQTVSRLQTIMTGGGVRKASTTGVSWNQRFICMGNSSNYLSPSGYFDITMPTDGTVIPVHGATPTTNVTVASGTIPMADWYALYYEIPLTGVATSVNANFHMVSYAAGFVNFDIPPNWVFLCVRNADTKSALYSWFDGITTDPWKALTLTSSWVVYGSSWPVPAWRFGANGKIELRGLMKNGLTGVSNKFATLPYPELGPEGTTSLGWMSNQSASGGVARIDAFSDASLCVIGVTAPATNAYVSLDNMSWYPSGT